MSKVLFVANVCKEHILKFHIPTIKMLKDNNSTVDVACAGTEPIPYCDHQYNMSWKRSPFSPKLLVGISELKRIIDRENYDVIYCHTPVGGFAARIAGRQARKKGTKIIYFAHGLHFYKGAPAINWLIYYPIEKVLAKQTDAIITINDEDYENAQKRLKVAKVFQLPGMGINLDAFKTVDVDKVRLQYRQQLNIPKDAFVLIYLAELLENKNQQMIVDALKLVLKKNPNTYLVLAGVDHTDGKFMDDVKQSEVANNVIYLGWRDDKENLYAMADLCTASSIREGFGLNLVEALAMGLPIVATDNRGHRTIVTDEQIGYLVEIGDVNGFAHAILFFAEHSSEVATTSLYRENMAANYSDKITLSKIEKIVMPKLNAK